MASNKMEGGKCHGAGDVKAALRHNDCSPKMRAIAAKDNEHIDVRFSQFNVNLTGDTYAERCAKYDKRIAELDAQPGANKRKDRVTGQLIETPVPAGLSRDDYNDFLRRVLDIQRDMFGAENLISADIHWDEEHEYTDPVTHELVMSRVHLQSVFVPVRDGKLYGQAIYSRKNLYALNNAVQKMAADEFGVDFLTGEGKRSKDTVGQLKAKSAAAAIVAAAEQEAQAMRDAAQAEAGKMRQAAQKAAGAVLTAAKAEAGKIKAEAENELTAAQETRRTAQDAARAKDAFNVTMSRRHKQDAARLRERERELRHREQEVEQREQEVAKKEAAMSAMDRAKYRQQLHKLEQQQEERKRERQQDGETMGNRVQPGHDGQQRTL